jgi:hypothetical protein
MMRQPVVIGHAIGHVIAFRQIPDDRGGGININGRGLTASGHGSPLVQYSNSLPENPSKP